MICVVPAVINATANSVISCCSETQNGLAFSYRRTQIILETSGVGSNLQVGGTVPRRPNIF